MKKLAIIIAALAMFTGTAMADGYVNGYTRSDGTYVPGHYRSSPNSTSLDNNYSTKGNSNFYTGQQGTKTQDYGFDGFGSSKQGKGGNR